MDDSIKLVILISGNGTNLQAVIDEIKSGGTNAQILRVISNRKAAFGLQRARNAGIPVTYHNLLKYKNSHENTAAGIQAAREAYDSSLAKIILTDNPDAVVCLGFLHVLSPCFIDPLMNVGIRTINLHPALPGAFSGANAIERAHAAWKEGKIDKTGVMVHEVIAEVDMGAPILVREISLEEGVHDNLRTLEERIHKVEWEIVPEAITMLHRQMKKAAKSSNSSF